MLNTGTVTANATAYTNLYSVAVFCWAEGGSFTFSNTGTLTATGHCTMAPFSSAVNTFYGGSSRGPVTLYNSGTVIGIADTNGGGGWAYGTENDNGDPISVVNTGTLSHNTGLGLFIYGVGASSNGVVTVTNTASGSIYGGLEGIAAEHYAGQLTIYDYGTVMAGTSNNNAMNLGSASAIVTVQFHAEVVSATKDKDGTLIEGSADQVKSIADEWTFARSPKSRDPNWKLVATNQLE